MEVPKFNEAKGKSIAIIAIVIVIVVLIFVFGDQLVSLINKVFHIFDNPAADAAKAAIASADLSSANPNSPFSPGLYNANPEASTLDYDTLQQMCDAITGAVSILPNFMSPPDGATIYAQFKMCANKIDVSNLAIVFSQYKGKDLYTFVSTNLSSIIGLDDQTNLVIMQQILTFVNNLPAQ